MAQPTWSFVENYPGVGPALVSGPCIVAIKDASNDLLSRCPAALQWLEGPF